MPKGAGKISWDWLRNWQPTIHVAEPAAPAEILGRYALGLGLTVVAFLIRLWLDSRLQEHYAFTTFLLATIIVNWWCGSGPAVLTTLLGLLAGLWCFVPLRGTFLVKHPEDWIGVGIYLVVGLTIAGLGWMMRQAHSQLARNMREVADHRAVLAREVQERKEAEAALRQSEQRLHAFVNSNVIGILIVNLRTGAIYEANDAFLNLIGRSRQDLNAGRLNLADVTAPEYAHLKEMAYREALRGEPIHPVEKEYVRPEGTRVSALLGGVALGPDRETAMTFVLDMTERKRLERELREQEEEFRTAFQLSAVGQAQACLVTGRLQRVNSRFCEMTGYAEEELQRMSYLALVHPHDRGGCQASFERVVSGEVPILETECRYVRKDGGLIDVVVSAALIRDASGQPLRVAAAVNDITQRKETAAALVQAKEKLQRVLDSITEGFFAVDRDLRFLEVNRVAAEDIFRRPEAELLGKSLAEEYPATMESEIFRDYPGFMVAQNPVHLEARSDMSGRWFEVHIYPYPDRLEVYVHDVTRRKEDQLALQTAQEELHRYTENLEGRVEDRTAELRQSLKSMQEFTYTIAHDLRAPLRAAHSFATLLLQHHAASLNAEGREFTERIAEAALRMDQLIRDLLEYGRVASAEVRLGPVDTERLVAGAVREAQAAEGAAGAQIEVASPLPRVVANSTLLHQSLAHLLRNAIKFVAPGVTPRIRVLAEVRDDWVRLKVCDNGIGIPREFHAEIFRTFQRLAPAEYAGTGMGLAIVQKAAERMRGRVGLESEPGRGSCFWVELPRAA